MSRDELTASIYALVMANEPGFTPVADPTDMVAIAKRLQEYYWTAYPGVSALNDIANRGYVIDRLCEYLRNALTDFALVKPYHGELDRFSKKAQIQHDNFPAMVNLATPFALVISKDRIVLENKSRTLRVKHEISIYLGDSNPNDFAATASPRIFTLMKQCLEAMNGQRILQGAGEIVTVSDGEYLASTSQFTVYDQKYYQLETIF